MLFKDRTVAGQVLAKKLADYANRSNVLVLALPRGGVPVGFEVARALNAPLDVLVVRKLGVPDNEELAMGALAKLPGTGFASGGVRILNQSIVNDIQISDEVIARVAVQEERELERRESMYRGDRPFPNLQGQTVILVDDGLATGATMWAAIIAVRQQQPKEIVIAVPVAAPETCDEMQNKVEKIVCANTPSPFYSVGMWYEKFPQTTDDEVRELLNKANNNHEPLLSGN
ncbi:Phosphoribosyltransferase [Trichormus variabilis ATCC 29413]|uniref:Phosphoribosyltransferase n=2 Tax=Anabaena variabilis TaxID=264691 RepID=Q3M369_TRIV2|nr:MULTISPECIES: phosphoribosyltransferase [Nostocaceae]ABA24567.1 Phosphoribosyltransferase [Trichormus variabilis ATCC 29413]MBC1215848.1 phosphoribosyltransferase [Trichormus variabilis ARAD]MBC1258108.1 phosphoribosyltransferase [Trichormus variabilis V5]MBC1266067.1 phosphoribosyltransferase [Trichormus variabilis FSR]MBC1304459.1 phosphoribosyltransferase [Trichormus variabilis N2B]